VLAEESDAAYDRVGAHRVYGTLGTADWLALPGQRLQPATTGWRCDLGSRVAEIDRVGKSVLTVGGDRIDYDALVLATGSYAFRATRAPDTTCRHATSTAPSTTSTRSAPDALCAVDGRPCPPLAW